MSLFAPSWTSTRAADTETEFFEKKIRPVLIERCYKCHSERADKVKGGLLLDSREAIRRGGESGAAVVPGDLNGSLLLSAIRYEDYEMPPDGKLADSVIADFAKWIKSGALDPREAPEKSLEPAQIDWDEARSFWSFQRPRRSPIPAVASKTQLDGDRQTARGIRCRVPYCYDLHNGAAPAYSTA